MPAPRKYDDETRERAVRMYQDRRRDSGQESAIQSRRRVGELLDVKATHFKILRCSSRDWKQLGEAISQLLQLQSLKIISCKAGDELVAPITNCRQLVELTICNELLIQMVVVSLTRELR